MTEMPLSQLSHPHRVHRCLLGRARDIDGGGTPGGLAARQGRRCGGCGVRDGGAAGPALRPCELAARWVPLGGCAGAQLGGRRGIGSGRPEGLGLIGMRERVGLLEGRLAIESSEGSGTTIAVEVPIR